MTAVESGALGGRLVRVATEAPGPGGESILTFDTKTGRISAALRIGASVESARSLQGNEGISNTGVKLHGSGFLVSEEKARALGWHPNSPLSQYIVRYRHGRDISQINRGLMVIDLHGLTSDEVRERFPAAYQHVLETVKPERDHNNEKYRREHWWLFGRKNTELRASLSNLSRFIATPETAKHRYFVFLDGGIRPDNMLVAIGSPDGFVLGVLSSSVHVCWATAAGGRMGIGNDPRYNKTRCFETYPFPVASDVKKQCIRELGEQLDAHRKARQAEYPKLTMTGMYNVLEQLRSGETLSAKEQSINEQGLVSVLKQIHDDLDAAVADAYGWPVDLADEEILERLVALNHERAEEEKRGLVRWLRPEYQNPSGETQQAAALTDADAKPKKAAKARVKKQPWPKAMAEQAAAVAAALGTLDEPADEAAVAKRFSRANKERIAELLATLAAIGKARQLEDGRYAAA